VGKVMEWSGTAVVVGGWMGGGNREKTIYFMAWDPHTFWGEGGRSRGGEGRQTLIMLVNERRGLPSKGWRLSKNKNHLRGEKKKRWHE